MKRETATFIVLILLNFALVTFKIQIKSFTELPETLSSHVISLFQNVQMEGKKTIHSIVEAGRILEENRKLKQEILELKNRLALMHHIEAENIKLKKLLGIKRYVKRKTIPAMVVGWTGDYWQHRFILNKGRINGVQEGMAVVGANGIVGQVRKVYKNHCIAISNIDPEFSVHVEDYRSKIRGMARGNGKRLTVDYVPPSMDVKVGDLLVSTGIDGIFPGGLYVGRVIRVTKSLEEKFLDIEAVPTDRVENNRFVLIVGEKQVAQKKAKKRR